MVRLYLIRESRRHRATTHIETSTTPGTPSAPSRGPRATPCCVSAMCRDHVTCPVVFLNIFHTFTAKGAGEAPLQPRVSREAHHPRGATRNATATQRTARDTTAQSSVNNAPMPSMTGAGSFTFIVTCACTCIVYLVWISCVHLHKAALTSVRPLDSPATAAR
jgi:hypothetical protein